MANLQGKKVAVLVDNYFEQAEFEQPITALKEAGVEVTVVSSSGMDLQALRHAEKGDTFRADKLLDDVDMADYDALLLPGGAMNADKLRMVQKARDWVRECMDSNKPLAVICHAPWVLVSADCVKGKNLTSYYTIQDDVRNAGGEWADKEVVTDGNLITSRKPDDIPVFNETIKAMLAQ